MAIRFILGRSGSGKTSRCLDDIRELLRREPDGPPLVLLVPEQATFQAEHALVSTPGLGGTIRAQVLSFRRLAFRIMQEAGGTARVHIDDSGKKMLLYELLHRYADELAEFRASSDQMGFIDRLNRMYGEFRRYCITPERLEQFVRGAERSDDPANGAGLPIGKLNDLLFVYKRFEERLSNHYIDSEHLLTKLAELLPASAYAREARVWIDGFYGFTPQEMQVIGELMTCSRDVAVSLCVDRDYGASDVPDELDLFHPTARTLVRLKRIAEERGAAVEPSVTLTGTPPRFARSPKLAHVERSLEFRGAKPFGGGVSGPGGTAEIKLVAAVNRRAEAEGVAREIVRLVRDEGCRWRDVAVTVRNPESYADLLAVTFADYGIPFFLDKKRSVLHHPVVELIRSGLEVAAGNWRNDAVFRCVKTDLLFPLVRDDDAASSAARTARLRDAMCRLENYVLAAGIQGSRWTETRDWTYRVGSMLDDVQEESGSADERFYAEMNRLRRIVVKPLAALEEGLREADSVRGMAEALYRFLESVDAPAKLERWSRECLADGRPEQAREHAQVWGSVVDLLDQIVEVLGDETLSLERFAGLVDAGLESVRLGLVPPSLDQVLVGTMDRTRSGAVRHMFVLGANDGVLPAKPEEDGVLSEPERERLTEAGLELAEGSRRKLLDEPFLLYAALTTPSDSLWISYPLADEEGKSLLPSEIVKRFKTMFPTVKERLLATDPPVGEQAPGEDPYEYAVRPDKALSHLAVQLRQWMRGVPIAESWWDVYNWMCARPAWRERLRRTLRSLLFTNREEPLPAPLSRELYGELLRASVSRMERFVACPFSQFASHGLRLAERRVYRLDAPDIGQLFHAALSRIALELQREGVDWGALSADECFERASRVVDELAPRLQGEILLSSKRYGYIARKLKQIVGRASVVLGVHARRGEFVPIGLEVGFGPDQPLPPLEFELDNGCRMQIVGRIDRVDRADSEKGVLLRVIDYKSSDTSLRLAEVFYGMSLQMLTYLDVVLTHAERWIGAKATPAGVLYFHVHNPLLVRKNALSPEEAAAQMLKRFKMKGLVLEDAETVRLMDGSLRERSGHSELVPVALKTDGGFQKVSSVVTEPQWDKLRGFVRKTIRRIGEEITDGCVDIRPFRMGPKLACTFCPYKPVCQFEPLFEGNDYRKLHRIDKDTVWQTIGEAAPASEAHNSDA
ncbi:helicase-exonuclease AddAB subunit AddB [Paenibacillus flagellatus]|uniref:ATP-dependent helicase/deoxyribonuclease subunit B n=1 Tax=Paenibacillus flagellatus TaxID=2211139 RepID=A0A2V5JY53_9BACL|nr:helicase-exonuclease AddAB subunit AddB [Paenibacillus flagellatus]PYI51795.1 helicase-exonuclease AddAB subunit AddB [Paenibacillus flagellatus]